MKTIDRVAKEPDINDEVVFMGGRLAYRVREVVISPNPKTGGRTTTVRTEREETFREEPYVRTQEVLFQLPGWTDLVQRGAATVR